MVEIHDELDALEQCLPELLPRPSFRTPSIGLLPSTQLTTTHKLI